MLLSLGMNKNDVMQIMGSPRRTDVNQERERWIYWNKALYGYTIIDNEQLANDRLVITFVNGKVTKWGQQTLTDDIMESSQRALRLMLRHSRNSHFSQTRTSLRRGFLYAKRGNNR